METMFEEGGNVLVVKGVDAPDKFRLIDGAIKQADLVPDGMGIRRNKEIFIRCCRGSEERLQKVAALLGETFS